MSEKEARIYVANLMLGPATVQKIADQADIKRVTTYVILESLASLGLVSQSNQGKKTYFSAEDPISLRRLLAKKEQQIADQKTSFEGILPELQSLKNMPSESPGVKFYDGAEGIRTVMATFLLSQKQKGVEVVYGISNLDLLHDFFPEIGARSVNPSRLDAGLPSKLIYTTTRGAIYASSDKQMDRESVYVPLDKYPIEGDLTIVGNQIVMLSLSGNKPIGITIESKELAHTMMALFNMAWDGAKSRSQNS